MAETIPCPACGTDNNPDAVRCHVCDYTLRAQLPGPPTNLAKCPRCGSGVAPGAAFCQVCGQAVDQRHPRPHTGALNVRDMFGPRADGYAVPTSPQPPGYPQPGPDRAPVAPGYVPPGPAPAPGYGPGPAFPAPAPAAARPGVPASAPTGASALPSNPAGPSSPSGPRASRRSAPRLQPSYAGFNPGDSAQAPAPTPVVRAQAPAQVPVVTSPPAAPVGYAPRREDNYPPGPGATGDNLVRPRGRTDAHAEPAASGRPQTDVGFGQAASAGYGAAQPWVSAHPPASASVRLGLRLVLVGRDGQEGESFPIPAHGVEIGRSGAVAFPSDPFVSPAHARITPIDGGVHLADLGSRNGVYLRLTGPVAVYPGDFFLLGNQLLRLDRLASPWQERPLDGQDVRGFGTPAKPPWAMLTRVCVGEIDDDRYHLRGTEITIGREQGEIVFANDGFLSRAHARVRMEVHDNTMSVVLEDLDSANGTYLRIRGAVNVAFGGMFRVGDQIFRVRNN